jgi:chemotaxis signal transduction protein
MYEEGERQRSVLFRIYKDGDLYSIPIQCITRVEPLVGRPTAVARSPNHMIGVYLLHGKNIGIVDLRCLLGFERTTNSELSSRCLLMIENTGIGFLVEAVLGVETLRSYQRPDPLSKQFIQCVYSCDSRDELVLGLDVPRLLSIC